MMREEKSKSMMERGEGRPSESRPDARPESRPETRPAEARPADAAT